MRRRRLAGEPRPLTPAGGPGSRPSLPYCRPQVEPEVEIVPEPMITPATPGWVSFGGEDPSGLYIQIPDPEPTR
jgi:hypothetical protein